MKYRVLSLLAFAGILFSSCVKENLPAEGGSILAVMENDGTKTSVTDEGVFTWSDGDEIWLHTTSGSTVGTLTSGAGTASANFSYGAYFGDMTGRAVYPYNSGHAISGDELSVVMPSSYDLGSNLTNTNAAMYGVNVEGTLKFNHMAGVMRFKFKNVPAEVNKFMITLDKKINGTFTADLTETYPVIKASETSTASEKTITLNFTALTETSDIALYVPLPLGTYNSLELGLYADTQSVWTYSSTASNTISRKSLILMPTITLGGTIGGEIEGGASEDDQEPAPEPQSGDYVDEYGINHGQGIKIGGTVWAPVNCGYHATDYKYGKLYQWGRKYGQGYNGELYGEDDNTIGAYSDATFPAIEEGGVSVAIGNHISKANVFFTSNYDYGYDWAYPRNGTLWNTGSESNPVKTEYDPCPDGWRVPSYTELSKLSQNFSSWVSEDGQNGRWFGEASSDTENVPQIFLPAAGHHYLYNRNCTFRNYFGDYWSSKPESGAYSLRFSNEEVAMYAYINGRASAYSVRCVQDDATLIPVENIALSKSSLTFSLGTSETLSTTIMPSNANHQSAYWWSENPEVASVNQNGNVTAVSTSTTTIYAMAGMQVATCEVTVTAGSQEGDYVDEYGVNHGQGIRIGTTVWAPVNCGYHATDYKYGKLYQWGRKYGQGYIGNLYDGDWNYICEYSDASVPEIVAGPVSLAVGQSEANAGKFYYNSTNPYDWLTSPDDNLWNSGTEDNPVRTEYDPCPYGWRVPTNSELSELCTNYSSQTTDANGQSGRWFSGTEPYSESVPRVFFPAAGGRYDFNGNAGYRGCIGRYWSSSTYSYNAGSLGFSSSSVSMNNDGRAYGFSVRCLQVTD